METWTPEVLFIVTYAVTVVTCLGHIYMQEKPPGIRIVIGTVVVYGAIGSALGMLVGFVYFGGKYAGISSTATGLLVGGHVFKIENIASTIFPTIFPAMPAPVSGQVSAPTPESLPPVS